MGLGFWTKAKIQAHGLLHRKPGRDALFRRIRQIVLDHASDPLLRRLVTISDNERTLFVTLHPCAESVEFVRTRSGEITVRGWTSTVGPGYHAHVIDLLDRVGDGLQLEWDWSDEDGGDKAGYAEKRDFPALQRGFARFLRELASDLLKENIDERRRLVVNMPPSKPEPFIQAYSLTPVGLLGRDWWEGLLSASPGGLAAEAAGFYPWWNKGADASFWLQTAKSMLWMDVPWRSPMNQDESELCQLARDCLNRAASLDPSVELPPEAEELNRLIAGPTGKPVPPPTQGIGYRRHRVRFPATGSWTVILPGYYCRQWDEGGSVAVFRFGDRTVQLKSLSIADKKGRSPTARDLLWEETPDHECKGEVVVYEEGHLIGRAEIDPPGEGGRTRWMLSGMMASHGRLCMVMITYRDPLDKEWAVEVFKSVYHPDRPPAEDERES